MAELNATATMSNVLSATATLTQVVIGGAIEATGDATVDQVLAGSTFSNATAIDLTGTMPNIGKEDFTPTTANQSVSEGYHDGTGVVAGDAYLIAENIKQGVSIFGVAGNVEPQDLTAYETAIDAVNGESSVDLNTAIALTASTKLAIETAIETAGVDVPALTPFADYAAYVADAVATAQNECMFSFNAANGAVVRYNMANGNKDVVIPDSIGGVSVVRVAQQAFYGLYVGEGPFFVDSIHMSDNIAACDLQTFLYCGATTMRISENAGFITLPQQFCTPSLVEVTIPSQITTINTIAFQSCPIIKIIIPANVSIADDGSMGAYGAGFRALYNSNGKLAGTYEYAAGTWSKTA